MAPISAWILFISAAGPIIALEEVSMIALHPIVPSGNLSLQKLNEVFGFFTRRTLENNF